MASLSNIAIIVSILLSAVALPFVANPDFSALKGAYDESLTAILNKSIKTSAEDYPGVIEKRYGPEEFYYKAKTAFGEIELIIQRLDKGIKTTEILINPNVTVTYTRENNEIVKETWTLKTNTYTLEIQKNYSTILETFSTPAGTCKKKLYLGIASQNCDGAIYELEDRWNEAKKLLKDYAENMKSALEKVELIDISDEEWKY